MFEMILMGCVIVMALSLLVGLAGLILVKDELSRAVMADLIFYAMVTIFLVWSIWTQTMIGYEIAILAGLVCGVIPTISTARIITRGRR